MKLEVRKYKGIDILRLPFMVAPFLITMRLVLEFLQAILPTTIMVFATAFFIDTAISIFNNTSGVNEIYLPLGILLLLSGVNSVLSALPSIIESKIEFTIERSFKPTILSLQANLAYKHIENAESWELIGRATDDLTENFLRGISAYGMMLRCIVSIVAVLGLILTQVWWATVVITVFSIPLVWASLWVGKKNYYAEVETYKYERRYSYYTNEMLTNREAVEERTLFGYAPDVTRRFVEKFEIARKKQLWVRLKTYVVVKAFSISLVVVALVIAFAMINPVIYGSISPGMYVGIVVAVFGIARTIGSDFRKAIENISESSEYMKDMSEFIALERNEDANVLPDTEPLDFQSLEFRNVFFKYPTGHENIFNGLSFTLSAGKRYAFVGANGAGKTTITKLLTGLYCDYDGEILINGKELRTYPSSTIKALFSVVYQDFARYQISMVDNITIGNTAGQTSTKQIGDIITKLMLNDTVDAMTNGLNNHLGRIYEDGVDISGGQWQKIAIARSLVSKASVKILDEPTASLDPIAESKIYHEFKELMKDKTTLLISHRLGSIKLVDEILVIDEGRIIERGNHQELIKINGTYANMYETQKRWYE